jgi:DNA excision repair protein ERCC-4
MSTGPHTPTFALPALKSLGELCSAQIILIQDSREQLPLKFEHLPCVVRGLQSADYSIVGFESEFGIERKNLDDAVACCMGENRTRFERELHRLRGFRFKRLLIQSSRGMIETQRYRSRISPKAVLATLAAFEVRWDIPVVFCETPEGAALAVERYAFYFVREYIKRANDLLRGSREATLSPNNQNIKTPHLTNYESKPRTTRRPIDQGPG